MRKKKKMEKFTKKKDELLIDLVRCNSLIYDASDKHHKNYIIRYKVWENISETLDIPVADVKKRWKHIRDLHTKKKRNEQRTGQAKSKNNWEYMSLLTFLTQAPSQPSTFTNVDENGEEANIETDETENTTNQDNTEHQESHNETQNTDSSNTSSQRPITERKRKSIFLLEKRQEEKAGIYEQFIENENTTPTKKFFDAMGDIVSQFPPKLAAEARLKVCKVVTEIEMKMHGENSRISTRIIGHRSPVPYSSEDEW